MRPALLISTLLASSAFALEGFPASVSLDETVQTNKPTLSQKNFDQLAVIDGVRPENKRGAVTRAYLSYVPEAGSHPAAECWARWEPLLKKAGWATKAMRGGAYYLKRTDGKVDSWLELKLGDFQDPLVTLIRVEGAPTELKLTAPASSIGTVADTADWPFLAHFPGATLSGTSSREDPFIVPGVDGHEEALVVADGFALKTYTPPATLSQLETMLSYQAALTKAGWEVRPLVEGGTSLIAHYEKGGRDVWVSIGRSADDSDTGLTYAVADVGATDFAKALDAQCRMTLRGVNFDFNKATLKADSNPVIEAAAAALRARPKLVLEVQGHTDSMGNDAYNEKLSQARAESVRTWLTSHGVPAAQLTARGFGETQPIADNESDLGRARNRRVELVCKQ